MNRLKLDFNLITTEERSDFVNKYIQKKEFETRPLTSDELETIANYILWGKDSTSQKSAVDEGEIEIETRNKTWKQEIESLDGLFETPGFTESQIRPISAPPLKKTVPTFNRSEALNNAPPNIKQTLQDLFRLIDTIDLQINFYELAHKKRKNPPRAELIKKFTPEEQQNLQELVSHWNQYKYLRHRHLLVELRREQFTIRDSYVPTVQRHSSVILGDTFEEREKELFRVLPLGIWGKDHFSSLIFKERIDLNPKSFSEEDLEYLDKFLWDFEDEVNSSGALIIDFSNEEHLYKILNQFLELKDSSLNSEDLEGLLRALEFYINLADLSEAQRKVLEMKIQKKTNGEIRACINDEYGKSYTENYISTIFRQKVIPRICAAAKNHKEIIYNLWEKDKFKKCSCCGVSLLRNTDNFIRKSRSPDGFSSRCKRCDKKKRQEKKLRGD